MLEIVHTKNKFSRILNHSLNSLLMQFTEYTTLYTHCTTPPQMPPLFFLSHIEGVNALLLRRIIIHFCFCFFFLFLFLFSWLVSQICILRQWPRESETAVKNL